MVKERKGVSLLIKENMMGKGIWFLKMGKTCTYLHNKGEEEEMLNSQEKGVKYKWGGDPV